MKTMRERERLRIEKSFMVFDLTAEQKEWILEALDSKEWDWFEDCDGCTGVSELHWPTKYFPPCLRHDFDWMRGDGGWDGSKRFYELQRAYGVPVWRSALRSGAVTVVWYGFSRWEKRIKP
ncbi:MAG: hypothetical protein JJU29_18455 [Verrucomicrobia bacterium]|nr:hypothetical protein [Verrucomicrobiota bacterium]MCH8512333.1 phospholipase [Kiritimatiellia bacterium]